jgi:serine/threonine-protein kinase
MRNTDGDELAPHPFGLAGALLDGKYRVDRLVAEGGFGVVYAGHHIVLDVPIAIKVLKTKPGDLVEQSERFSREAQTIAKLKHPSIVQVLDAGIWRPNDAPASPAGPLAWMVLEWLTGQTLKANLVGRRGLGGRSPAEAMALIRPVLDAVAYAHSKQVVHRDLKPSNIMLSPGQAKTVVKVLDFGVSKVVADESIPDSEHSQTHGPSHAFSRAYAAPEQVAGGRTGPWTDVHALGLLLTELLTDEAPYPSPDPTELYELVFSADRPSPARCGVHVGPWQSIIERAVSLKPSRRFADVPALAAALQQSIDDATAAFESSSSRGDHSAERQIVRASSTDSTLSDTASDTFSVVSSRRPRATVATWSSRRNVTRAVGIAAVLAGSYVAWTGLRSTGRAREASQANETVTPPVLDVANAIPVTAAIEAPQAMPAQTPPTMSAAVPRKKARPAVPRRPDPTPVDSPSTAPSMRPELPAYEVE